MWTRRPLIPMTEYTTNVFGAARNRIHWFIDCNNCKLSREKQLTLTFTAVRVANDYLILWVAFARDFRRLWEFPWVFNELTRRKGYARQSHAHAQKRGCSQVVIGLEQYNFSQTFIVCCRQTSPLHLLQLSAYSKNWVHPTSATNWLSALSGWGGSGEWKSWVDRLDSRFEK